MQAASRFEGGKKQIRGLGIMPLRDISTGKPWPAGLLPHPGPMNLVFVFMSLPFSLSLSLTKRILHIRTTHRYDGQAAVISMPWMMGLGLSPPSFLQPLC
ncbi:uncharacterized protein TrAtP1_002000 [Trichoderma atroviride]|uniref:uncharacterized protein n=1 Tax=Hypocrea atroviridis TaxID=63577 RepID=UPI003330AB75|nr:hypothetical protein TrAtP1_002000 [Trichoderma atroviride]